MGVPDWVKEPNCTKCRYNHHLKTMFDVHVDMWDCDHCGEEFCKRMNDPAFIKWIYEREAREECDNG